MSRAKKATKSNPIRKVLNVGGGSKTIPLPEIYNGWNHVLLDINPQGNPDVVCDARNLATLPANEYDAIYCSHNLEHYHHHEVQKVLQGFFHLLKQDGFAHVRVPDMKFLMTTVVEKNLDMDDVLYLAASGIPVLVRDVIYGWGAEIEASGQDYYTHKTGFTPLSLRKALHNAGFLNVYVGSGNLEVLGIAFKAPPSEYAKNLFNLPDA